jgi:hypothetical protein
LTIDEIIYWINQAPCASVGEETPALDRQLVNALRDLAIEVARLQVEIANLKGAPK